MSEDLPSEMDRSIGCIAYVNTYSFRIMTQSGVAKFDFFEIFYTQGPFRWKG